MIRLMNLCLSLLECRTRIIALHTNWTMDEAEPWGRDWEDVQLTRRSPMVSPTILISRRNDLTSNSFQLLDVFSHWPRSLGIDNYPRRKVYGGSQLPSSSSTESLEWALFGHADDGTLKLCKASRRYADFADGRTVLVVVHLVAMFKKRSDMSFLAKF
ncbi:hypothetical protein NEOLEDRAFT_1141868 [Neolentinus lepideus HHB14362 ss-1]|uniref:Uncharacterized protein n=1 Tax=Neolentinus lepideus HHB14362 ss-1 TaxID=1314782 RepID=A0A165NGK4_9AGAM|nr:hypothetical protein NEOLEDRAFT_1141868 [Neolentinus lepideus HHB14362 ss-1]